MVTGIWKNKRILVTGHTGFKGAWAARVLACEGADVIGLSLPPEPDPTLYAILGKEHFAGEHFVDLRDQDALNSAVIQSRADIVLHMAAQPLVRRSYADPIETYATNFMGTVHLLESLRECDDVSVVLCVTSDKVYENKDTGKAFSEQDQLGGHDPYSASKAAMELAVASFARSFFDERGVAVATARAGNVIGGGDFANDRLVPDIVRAVQNDEPLVLRYPNATRPWGHVLDCVYGYMSYIARLHDSPETPRSMNFGPRSDTGPITAAELAETILSRLKPSMSWQQDTNNNPIEKQMLLLDAKQAESTLGWTARLAGAPAVDWTAEWYEAFLNEMDMATETDRQIDAFNGLDK